MKPTALVTGAAGFLGRSLLQELVMRGYSVRALVRSTSSVAPLPDTIEVVHGDVADSSVVQSALAGMDYVFHLAAKLHMNDPPDTVRDEYHRVNLEGTRIVAKAARTAGVRRLVFFSTINVYGTSRPNEVHGEGAPLHPDSIYAATKAAAEESVLSTVPGVVLRLAAVYGPGMKGNYLRLLHALRKGHFVLIGNGRNRRTLVYVTDACRAAIAAAEHPAVDGQIYNVTDGSVHTLYQIVQAMSAALGQPPPRLRLPTCLARGAVGLLEDGFRLFGFRAPLGRATIDKLTEDIAVSGYKAQHQLLIRPEYLLARGWQETVQQNGLNPCTRQVL